MILHLRPDLVHIDRVRDDHRSAPAALSGVTLVRDFSQMTGPGAIGSPSQASAEKGQAMLSAIIARGVEVCRELLAMPIVTGRRPVDLPVD
jgi:creatinine amidohydrolase/Fe(II)-dependent formamide hydrolase-like protein